MAKLIMPNAENCSLAELETSVKAAPSKRSHNRLMAMRALLLGILHGQVADLYSVTRRTLSYWIKQFNDQGIDALIEHPRSGRPRKIPPGKQDYYCDLINHPEKADQTHWTAKKFHGYISDQLDHEVGYSTVVRWLHENNFKLKVPQSWPERQDEVKRQAFLDQLKTYMNDPQYEIWYLDESGFEGDPRPRRRWAKKGDKIRIPYKGEHIRMNVSGMICPRTGEFYALEFTHIDSQVFQVFLDNANKDIQVDKKRNLIICDNATWHKNKSIDWGQFEPVFLPPYSPDFNPIERLWLLIKAEWFSDFIARDRQHLVERLDQALLWTINRKEKNQLTCSNAKLL
jgi:transposase